jgi:hypothetical protein
MGRDSGWHGRKNSAGWGQVRGCRKGIAAQIHSGGGLELGKDAGGVMPYILWREEMQDWEGYRGGGGGALVGGGVCPTVVPSVRYTSSTLYCL